MKKKKSFLFGLILGLLGIGIGAFAMVYSSFSLSTKVDHTNNAIDLSWKEPDNEEPYTYKVFQKKDGSSGFQSISTADLKEKVKVLNIYPVAGPQITYTTWDNTTRTINKAGSLEMWMEKPNAESSKGYGMGLIGVDPVSLTDFNNNPDSYLKDSNGEWKYDAIFLGAWDANNYVNLNEVATNSVKTFIESGRGFLAGHDTIGYLESSVHFNKLAPLFNMQPTGGTTIGHTKVEITRRGLLLEYPWSIGDLGTVLDVPMSHTLNHRALGDVWMMYTDNTRTSAKDKLNDPTYNFYLTSWNNTAMIQTGHSNGAATPDEQKIFANSLFYLSQLTTDTSIKDRSGMDVTPPNSPKILDYSNESNIIEIQKPTDNGSNYEYYVEAKGQDTGIIKESPTKKITNTSGIAGYSYVVDNKTTTTPDNKVDVETETFNVDLSKANGDMLHIVAVDKAGNISKAVHYDLNLLTLEGFVDYDKNAVSLDWNDMPDNSQPYTYKVFQDKEGNGKFQSISTADLKKKVKVLNVYPTVTPKISYTTWDGTSRTLPKSASAEMWMESPNADHAQGYGMGLINVDPLSMAEFNSDPQGHLKNVDGSWKYDVIYFGAWDVNNSKIPNDTALGLVEQFIQEGRGVLAGHDTIGYNWGTTKGLSKLRDYFNVKVGYWSNRNNGVDEGFDYFGGLRSNQVDLSRKGLLSQYPWDLGEIGSTYTIPSTHSTSNFAFGDVWFRFYNESIWSSQVNAPDEYYDNMDFYLTTWNNTAMIQTGHSNGAATKDEQMILANTMFYLSQLTTETGVKDRSGMDVAKPTKPTNIKVSLENYKTLKVSYGKSTDKGSVYDYYVESTGQNDGRQFRSNTIKLENKSGLKGYSYVIDNKPNTIPDVSTELTGTSFEIDLSSEDGNYLHLVSVDKVGNISDVIHYEIDSEAPTFGYDITPEDWTNDGVQIRVFDIKDIGGFGYSKTIFSGGQTTTSDEPTFSVKESGSYQIIVEDKAGNRRVKNVIIQNIDTVDPNLQINEDKKIDNGININLKYSDK